ncbi:unnamed protein product [Parascedosporium putredinis]|uniref:Uncharacterized protein n=1 Tax=Parascedosporium putredinis TaxID=1442378 RepID=A0A9P1GYI7_9PEZI|nr:unnamed protein product [Parascedosporium putredinis]CAI7989994.1 unnamed protein product [Parascedosporium putredinis]
MDEDTPIKSRSKRNDDAHSSPSTPTRATTPADDTIHVDEDHVAVDEKPSRTNGTKTKVKKEVNDREEEEIANDEAAAGAADSDESRPKYRSWKKKWRKLRVTFDHKMQEAEVLWLREQKAKATIKRIAIENDRLLDLLTDINECPQVPFEKRFAGASLSYDAPEPSSLLKTLESLESEVPHLSFEQAKEAFPDALQDITPAPGEDEPAPFLTVDEIENYVHEIDLRLDLPKLKTLAPAAKEGAAPAFSTLSSSSTRDFLINESAAPAHDDDDHPAAGSASARKKGAKGDRSSKTAKAKRQSKVADRDRDRSSHRGDQAADVSMGEDDEYATPAAAKKRKRGGDDDGGYRPKGGSSSRPAKKKRKSDVEGTPLANKKRKSVPVEE